MNIDYQPQSKGGEASLSKMREREKRDERGRKTNENDTHDDRRQFMMHPIMASRAVRLPAPAASGDLSSNVDLQL